jgi:hypothetical protein
MNVCSCLLGTLLLTFRVPLDDVQHLAGHSSPRITRLYDRRQKKVTRNIVERISIWKAGLTNMEVKAYDLSSFLYAYSTIAQTIATAFALLTAIVMHQVQSITATFLDRTGTLGAAANPASPLNGQLSSARQRAHWDEWLGLFERIGFPETTQGHARDELTTYFQQLKDDIMHVRKIKMHARKAVGVTVTTILFCFVAIPCTNKYVICNDVTFGIACVAVVGATMCGINCVRKYRPLVLDVMKPGRAAKDRKANA